MASELDALIEEAQRKWSAYGIKLLPGATDSALAPSAVPIRDEQRVRLVLRLRIGLGGD